ncbi:MAG TPA: type II toxin-antitoxin system VapC family toxin [Nitrospirota bacterium]|nr:type II toxin-antitoxin system VapC family toxin [Nitrospirota bacterium]
MSGRYLLDANIIIALFAQETAVHERLTTAEEVFVPCVAVGELYFGAYKSLRVPENLSRIDEFAVDNLVLSCTADTARKYGEIKNRLKEKGQPIPENDIWIAAIARQHGLTLVTRDAHFDAVENLKVEVW